jgi:AcrR family transcriptional regulator
MGSKQRQAREREAVARAILDAARDLFVSEGYRNVSMRKIAERIEYSPAAIYRYFSSKDDIFFALAEEGFHLLADQATDQAVRSPLQEVRRAFLAFYDFSKAHPEYFALMFLDRSVPRLSQNWDRFAFVQDMKGHLASRIRACIAAGDLPARLDPEAAVMVLAASVHGAAVVRLCDRLGAAEDADALARDALEAGLAGLRSGSPVTFVAAPRRPPAETGGAAAGRPIENREPRGVAPDLPTSRGRS